MKATILCNGPGAGALIRQLRKAEYTVDVTLWPSGVLREVVVEVDAPSELNGLVAAARAECLRPPPSVDAHKPVRH